MLIDMRWRVNSSSYWAQQQLHLRLVRALGAFCIERRCTVTCSCGFLSQKKSTSLIHLCTNIYACTLIPQCCSTEMQYSLRINCLEALRLGLKNQKLCNIETRTKEISMSLRIITLAGSKSRFVQRLCLLCFGMQRELHALFAWMNGKCWNNCLTLFSGVTGNRILSCEFHWCMTDDASHFLFPSLFLTKIFILRIKHSSECPSGICTHFRPLHQILRPRRWEEHYGRRRSLSALWEMYLRDFSTNLCPFISFTGKKMS